MRRSDEEIKKDIVDQLFWDARVDASEVAVQVDEGVARLSGTVPTFLSRNAAHDDALAILGVKDVKMEIDVRYSRKVQIPSDEELAVRIQRMLVANPDIDSTEIQVEVQDGVVMLRGLVDAAWKKAYAEDIVISEPGVVNILNHMAVVPTRDFVDNDIARDIVATMERSALVDADGIDVVVMDGRVTLTGTVQNWEARRTAYESALYTPGVITVENNLAVAAGP